MPEMSSFADWLEFLLRVASAVVFSAVSVYIAIGLHFCGLRPRYVWRYVGLIAGAVTVWRWTIVALFAENSFPELVESLTPWLSHISASLFVLIAMAFFVLAYASNRKRVGDE